jgi:hypothetical protein
MHVIIDILKIFFLIHVYILGSPEGFMETTLVFAAIVTCLIPIAAIVLSRAANLRNNSNLVEALIKKHLKENDIMSPLIE